MTDLSSLAPVDLPLDPLGHTAPVDVLFDRLQLGFSVALTTLTPADAPHFCQKLARLGVLKSVPAVDRMLLRDLPVDFHVPGLPKQGRMTISGRLILRPAAGGTLAITNASQLVPNAVRALRSQLKPDLPDQYALGGETNFIGPHNESWSSYLGLQLQNIAHAIDTLVDAVTRAAVEVAGPLPGPLHGRIWLQQGEIFQDRTCQNAEALVQDVANRALRNTGRQTIRLTGDFDRDRFVIRWSEGHRTSAERKIYAKLADLLRIEIKLNSRKAVLALLRRAGAPIPTETDLTGASLTAMLAAVALAAKPLIDDIADDLDQATAFAPLAGVDFMLGFAPLLHLTLPNTRQPGTAGRNTDPDLPDKARRLLERLLNGGRCAAPSSSTPQKLCEALKAMSDGGVLLRINHRPAVYGVTPAFEAVRSALASARRRDDLDDDWAEA